MNDPGLKTLGRIQVVATVFSLSQKKKKKKKHGNHTHHKTLITKPRNIIRVGSGHQTGSNKIRLHKAQQRFHVCVFCLFVFFF